MNTWMSNSEIEFKPLDHVKYNEMFKNLFGMFIDEPSQHQIHKEKAGMIKKVIFNEPCTIVLWNDGTKTIVRAHEGEKFDKEKGLAMAFSRKLFGNTSYYYEIFREHIKETDND